MMAFEQTIQDLRLIYGHEQEVWQIQRLCREPQHQYQKLTQKPLTMSNEHWCCLWLKLTGTTILPSQSLLLFIKL